MNILSEGEKFLKDKLEANKPLIGILGHKHKGYSQRGYGQNAAYIHFFRKFGNVIILDALCNVVIPVDLLVLPGGADVNPLNYGQMPDMTTQAPDLEYEYFYKEVFPKYMKKRVSKNLTAVYGICAGFQHLVVKFGGTLAQDIYQDQSDESRGELVDNLELNHNAIDNLGMHNIYKKFKDLGMKVDMNMTNSIHHQGAFESNINLEEFEIIATNKVYNNVEFIKHTSLPIAAEQSHPEERYNPLLTLVLLHKILEQVNIL